MKITVDDASRIDACSFSFILCGRGSLAPDNELICMGVALDINPTRV